MGFLGPFLLPPTCRPVEEICDHFSSVCVVCCRREGNALVVCKLMSQRRSKRALQDALRAYPQKLMHVLKNYGLPRGSQTRIDPQYSPIETVGVGGGWSNDQHDVRRHISQRIGLRFYALGQLAHLTQWRYKDKLGVRTYEVTLNEI